ncbi:hypothetical protein [Streptomyces poriferorum]|uniref:Uncharacterized protein n=1 Tax=Streptomyces poriferorum TaxID=2798799 RepID=A0ABY9J2Q2_9ACTN|nr:MULTISPECIES: hypothetical protein [unclassified Streptomyces]MDP5310414.1 hypothetical protein [Streptomyces sp. Alt4]WLQ60432.1 hypothetical protein P8A19_35635 [Streptomyces sp. Alt2]
MTTRIPQNAKQVFYASETQTREDGTRRAGREQRSTTFREARDFLDGLDVPGGVSVWRASSNLTDAYATRGADGSWTSLNRLTGKWEPLS